MNYNEIFNREFDNDKLIINFDFNFIPLYNVHCTLYSVCYIPYTAQYIVYNVWSIVHSTVYNVYIVYSIQCLIYM